MNKLNRKIEFLFVMIALFGLSNCEGSKLDYELLETRIFSLSIPFNAIEVHDGFEVEMTTAVTSPTVTIPAFLYENMELYVVEDRLVVSIDRSIIKKCQMKLQIPMNDSLREVRLSGRSSMTLDKTMPIDEIWLSGESMCQLNIETRDLDIKLSGESMCQLNIEARDLDIKLSGESSAEIAGIASAAEIEISGESTLQARALDLEEISGEMSGESLADITVCGKIELEISGGSTLVYGTPDDSCHPKLDCKVSGESVIRSR